MTNTNPPPGEHWIVPRGPNRWPVETHPDQYECSCGSSIWIDGTLPVCVASNRTIRYYTYSSMLFAWAEAQKVSS